ncbi:MAG: class I SAM-dependent methyltransferase [Chloroflexi bacterium]|nr:MAG: class I SAM-dependent methyltransferase [Chloroflexota bacterium]
MSSGISSWLLASRRRKVGESVRGTVLDVGFGTGISREFYPAGVRVVGIDASRGMLEVARRSRADADLLVMDAERLAFADQSFDSVAFNLCLCTIPDPERAVPGAPMVFLEHVRSHLLPVALVQEALNPILVAWQADHFNRRTVDVVRRAGVEVVSVERWLLGVFNLIVGRAPAG